ncbi:MAG: HipA N-terminal domain-containing protein, partial [Firmicutes bacterium]|nr:HipA N-terminal domain-containing protein [Bacillota bacterium]
MTAATLPSALEVRIHDTMAGTIVAISARDSIFAFDETYIQREDRPVLSLGFTDSYGRLRTRSSRPGRIIPFFANLLPEGALRRYIAERAGIDDGSDLALLWLTGSDLPGAVTVRDPEGRAVPPLAVGGPSAPPPADALFRFSLAGVQLKFSALRNARGGLTIPATGSK